MTMAIMMRMRILILGWKLDNAILNERNDENDYGKPYRRCFPWKEWWLMSVHRSSSRKREYRNNSKLVHSFTLTGQKFSIRFWNYFQIEPEFLVTALYEAQYTAYHFLQAFPKFLTFDDLSKRLMYSLSDDSFRPRKGRSGVCFNQTYRWLTTVLILPSICLF